MEAPLYSLLRCTANQTLLNSCRHRWSNMVRLASCWSFTTSDCAGRPPKVTLRSYARCSPAGQISIVQMKKALLRFILLRSLGRMKQFSCSLSSPGLLA